MKKCKTNFVLNLQKIGCQDTNELENQNICTDLMDWIGITIDMKTLNIIPNINTKKDAVLCTLNVNMQTNESIMWLKKKLKSFLMNNISFYFRETINSKEFAKLTLNKLYQAAAEKYIVCCRDFKQYHLSHSKGMCFNIDLKIA